MKRKTFLLFISPSVIIMTLLMAVPFITAIYLSFNYLTYSNFNNPQFIGLENYFEVLSSIEFWESYKFTLVFILTTVPLEMLLGFLLALLLDQIGKGRGFYIAFLLIPFILTPVVGTVMFRTMFDRGGLYNHLLEVLFNYKLILNTTSVRTLIILHGIWYVTPFAMITYFAGLQTLPQNSLEAATVDGAGRLGKVWHIVLPHVQPLTVFIALIGIMDAYRVFDSILVMSRSNPAFKVDTIMYYNFKVATSVQRLGKANAISIITVIGILFVLIPFLRVTYKQQKAV